MSVVLNENAVTKVVTTTALDVSTAATTYNLFTVPAGHTFVPSFAVVRTNTASLAGMVATFGITTDKDSIFSARAFTNATIANSTVVISPIQAATPAGAEVPLACPAGSIVCFDITTKATAAGTAIVEMFGYFF